MSVVDIIFGILIAISSLTLIISVLMQEGQGNGLGAITGGSETFFGKNKSKTLEGKLAFVTKVSAGVFVVSSFGMLIFS